MAIRTTNAWAVGSDQAITICLCGFMGIQRFMPRTRSPVEEEHRLPMGIAILTIGDLSPIIKLDVLCIRESAHYYTWLEYRISFIPRS